MYSKGGKAILERGNNLLLSGGKQISYREEFKRSVRLTIFRGREVYY